MSGSMIAALLFLVPLALAQDAPPTMIEQQTELTTAVQDIEPLFAVGPMAAAPPVAGNVQSQAGWTVVCSSEQAPNGCSNVLDNNNSTYWQSGSAGWPHTITVDMKSTMGVSGIAMLPQNSTQGNIAVHELYLSTDGQNWGQPLAYGTWWGDATEKISIIQPAVARYVRLVSYSAALGENFLRIAALNVFVMPGFSPPPFNQKQGRWGQTIDIPIVPAGGWVDPLTGQVVTFSSYGHDRFNNREGVAPEILGRTLTSTWDPVRRTVSQRIVNNTGHDMFCPGLSFDVSGRMIVTGGRTNFRTTIYSNGGWQRFSDMRSARGYQSQTIVSDGQIFTIGGSWDSVDSQCIKKDGEIYNPRSNTWTSLPRCPVTPMLTAEKSSYMNCNTFRSDNHGWLFAWKQKTVFQAGPSARMNWYTASNVGGITSASNRADDVDAMCGTAVMYDAVAGKILTMGGSTTYTGSNARNGAYLMTLTNDNFNRTVAVTKAAPMINPRIYHNAVILPNGNTFVNGGRTRGDIFVDGPPSVLQPEIYYPATNTWAAMANHSTPRTYHSMAVLLPDATIFSGGGGLCGDCKFNHFDAQIFTPPYLLTTSGALATRPVITGTQSNTVNPGGTIRFTTNTGITSASLIRYGSATHGLNTDQRRIPLRLTSVGTNSWTVTVPTDSGILLPGYWMLFAMTQPGTPSRAATIQVVI